MANVFLSLSATQVRAEDIEKTSIAPQEQWRIHTLRYQQADGLSSVEASLSKIAHRAVLPEVVAMRAEQKEIRKKRHVQTKEIEV